MVCTSLHAIVNGNDTIIIVTFLFYLRRRRKKNMERVGAERVKRIQFVIVVDLLMIKKSEYLYAYKVQTILIFRFGSFIEKY